MHAQFAKAALVFKSKHSIYAFTTGSVQHLFCYKLHADWSQDLCGGLSLKVNSFDCSTVSQALTYHLDGVIPCFNNSVILWRSRLWMDGGSFSSKWPVFVTGPHHMQKFADKGFVWDETYPFFFLNNHHSLSPQTFTWQDKHSLRILAFASFIHYISLLKLESGFIFL